MNVGKQYRKKEISIHAPARGATNFNNLENAVGRLFQSTLPRGERLLAQNQYYNPQIFQSTLPRGERLNDRKDTNQYNSFQSTLPRGERRELYCTLEHTMYISIHAPARGATSTPSFLRFRGKIFQSTLPRGERRSRLRS